MNCAECQDHLIACAEGLLEREEESRCREHLETCALCRTEYAAVVRLQQRLVARGHAAAGVRMVGSVMQRVRGEQFKPESETLMSRLLKHRWGFGLGAAAGAAALLLIFALTSPTVQARAVDVMTKGAQAMSRLTSIHLRGQLRTDSADNFGSINPDGQFCTIELWKQLEPELKWRIEKPKRVVVMDGQSTLMLITSGDIAVKLPQPAVSAFDTEWLHRIANLSTTLSNELDNARAKGWKLSLAAETGADHREKSVVTVMARSGVPDNDYGKNTFIENADTRRVYRFDAESGLLEAVQVYLVRPSGEVQVFDLSRIDYNQPIDAAVWQLELPADVSWAQLEPPQLPDNEKYASLTARQAARAFFEACSREDWDEAGKFMSPLNERIRSYLGGLEIVSLGEPFTSTTYAGQYVPYEIKFRPQEFCMRVSNSNSAGRYVITGVFDRQLKPIQELTWSNEPALLPDQDTGTRMSPAEMVKRYFEVAAKFDWDEMRKFAPDYDVASDKAQIEEAEKLGMDPRKLIPTREVGEAFWSAEHSAWFVKCRVFQVKQWNLALRKDNPAGRWQVDGGL